MIIYGVLTILRVVTVIVANAEDKVVERKTNLITYYWEVVTLFEQSLKSRHSTCTNAQTFKIVRGCCYHSLRCKSLMDITCLENLN